MRRSSPVVRRFCSAVVALLAFGCGGSDGGGEAPLTGPPPVAPVIIEQPQSVSAFTGTLATFSVKVTGGSPITYTWWADGVQLNNNSPTLQIEARYLEYTPRTFAVVVSNVAGTVTSNNATLTVLPLPPEIIEQPQSVTVAVGAIAQFRVVMGGTPKFFCQWERSDNGGATWRDVFDLVSECNILPSTVDVYLTPPATLADSGAQFRVRVSNPSGEVISQIATLTVM